MVTATYQLIDKHSTPSHRSRMHINAFIKMKYLTPRWWCSNKLYWNVVTWILTKYHWRQTK